MSTPPAPMSTPPAPASAAPVRRRVRLSAAALTAVAALTLTACHDGEGLRDEGPSGSAAPAGGGSADDTGTGAAAGTGTGS